MILLRRGKWKTVIWGRGGRGPRLEAPEVLLKMMNGSSGTDPLLGSFNHLKHSRERTAKGNNRY